MAQTKKIKGKFFFLLMAFIALKGSAVFEPHANSYALENSDDYFYSISEEEMVYDLNFLWFKNVAVAKISFKKVNEKEFRVILDAETKGFIGWLFYRHQTYISHIRVMGDKDLRCVLFERIVIRSGKEERTISEIDYDNHQLRWRIYKDGRLVEQDSEPIPDGVIYEDILSAFYKFRFGLYGDIIKGKEYVVRTIPQKGVSKVTIRVASEEEEGKRDIGLSKNETDGYLVYVTVPKELFGSKTGIVKIWFKKNLIPVEGMVKDAIGLGDVIGVLRERKVNNGASTAGKG